MQESATLSYEAELQPVIRPPSLVRSTNGQDAFVRTLCSTCRSKAFRRWASGNLDGERLCAVVWRHYQIEASGSVGRFLTGERTGSRDNFANDTQR